MIRIGKFAIIIALVLFAGAMAKQSAGVPDPEYYRAKRAVTISDEAIQFLANKQTDGKVKIWVFFTDKGIYNKQQFTSAALSTSERMSERAKARRAKHGVNEVRFIDLPVNARYVDELAARGVKILSTSKWLNAAAIELPLNHVGEISRLSFVEHIQPTATYTRPNDEAQPERGEIPTESQALGTHSLSYGSSLTQLNQINVPICHDSGFTGQGVIIAMFDTGFRKTHNSFTQAYADGRVLAEWDFIFGDGNTANEAVDNSSQWSHGTSTWSTSGGENPGVHYGPAFDASFILCKTEDVRSETQVEEYNWEAAAEWVDSIGADIISSSLGYTDWYTTSNYNGDYCVITIAADIAASNGILVVNSAGNSGPGTSTLGAPADADSIVTVGAVTSSGAIASFSSRGPTADGRTKPEVCAMGSGVSVASSGGDGSYSSSSGTSFSCPLTAGVAALVMDAHPTWTNMQVREALMQTASDPANPDNTFGWGIVNAWAAIKYSFGPPPYVYGDADGNDIVTISDAVYLISYIFAGGPGPSPSAAGDADCSLIISIGDAVYLISYIFAGGPAPTNCEM